MRTLFREMTNVFIRMLVNGRNMLSQVSEEDICRHSCIACRIFTGVAAMSEIRWWRPKSADKDLEMVLSLFQEAPHKPPTSD